RRRLRGRHPKPRDREGEDPDISNRKREDEGGHRENRAQQQEGRAGSHAIRGAPQEECGDASGQREKREQEPEGERIRREEERTEGRGGREQAVDAAL